MPSLLNEQLTTLEELLDQCGLTNLLDALSSICLEKADHLLSNWQDKDSAKLWSRDAAIIQKAAEKVNN